MGGADGTGQRSAGVKAWGILGTKSNCPKEKASLFIALVPACQGLQAGHPDSACSVKISVVLP